MSIDESRDKGRDEGRVPLRVPGYCPDAAIAEEAGRWFALMADDAEAVRHFTAFSDWLAADPRHADAFAGLSLRPVPTQRLRLFGWMRLRRVQAAALGLALCTGVMLGLLSPAALPGAAGHWQTVAQADGSQLTFGPGSRGQVAFTPDRRLVTLTAGSVIVEAARDPLRPLRVETPHGAVQVVGTRFTVIVDEDSSELMVAHGEVRATSQDGAQAVSVRPSQRVRIYPQAVIRDAVPVTEPEEGVAGWRTLREAPLRDLIATVERENDLRILLLPSAEARAARVSGRFHVRDAAATLSLLTEAYGLRRGDAPFGAVILY